jgi:hypothetical protein
LLLLLYVGGVLASAAATGARVAVLGRGRLFFATEQPRQTWAVHGGRIVARRSRLRLLPLT